jgi:hypothetical protein
LLLGREAWHQFTSSAQAAGVPAGAIVLANATSGPPIPQAGKLG